MKWHLIFIVALMAALIPGCGGGDSDIDVVSDDVEESETPLIDGPAADVESPDASEDDEFHPPFPTNRSFFSPPEVQQTVALPNSVVADEFQHADVRVIGFSQIGDSEPQALVSIGGRLESVRAGDSFGGVTVVALETPNVTLNRRTSDGRFRSSNNLSSINGSLVLSRGDRVIETRRFGEFQKRVLETQLVIFRRHVALSEPVEAAVTHCGTTIRATTCRLLHRRCRKNHLLQRRSFLKSLTFQSLQNFQRMKNQQIGFRPASMNFRDCHRFRTR